MQMLKLRTIRSGVSFGEKDVILVVTFQFENRWPSTSNDLGSTETTLKVTVHTYGAARVQHFPHSVCRLQQNINGVYVGEYMIGW